MSTELVSYKRSNKSWPSYHRGKTRLKNPTRIIYFKKYSIGQTMWYSLSLIFYLQRIRNPWTELSSSPHWIDVVNLEWDAENVKVFTQEQETYHIEQNLPLEITSYLLVKRRVICAEGWCLNNTILVAWKGERRVRNLYPFK